MEYELYHHGILGMKWGIRRYQNPDGSLTPAGRRRLQQNAKNLENAKRNYEKARFLGKAKARQKYDKAADKYTKFASKLEYAKMSDKDLLSASHDFIHNRANQTVASTSVQAGYQALSEKIKMIGSIVTTASNAVSLVGQVKDTFNLGAANKQKLQIDREKMLIDKRKQDLDERKVSVDAWKALESNKISYNQQVLDYFKAKNTYDVEKQKADTEASKDRRYWRSYLDNYESLKNSESSENSKAASYDKFLSKEERDEIKRKQK